MAEKKAKKASAAKPAFLGNLIAGIVLSRMIIKCPFTQATVEKIIPAKHPNSSIRDLWDAMAQHMSITKIQSQAEGTGNQSQ